MVTVSEEAQMKRCEACGGICGTAVDTASPALLQFREHVCSVVCRTSVVNPISQHRAHTLDMILRPFDIALVHGGEDGMTTNMHAFPVHITR
jgi:hypothetical protein